MYNSGLTSEFIKNSKFNNKEITFKKQTNILKDTIKKIHR